MVRVRSEVRLRRELTMLRESEFRRLSPFAINFLTTASDKKVAALARKVQRSRRR